MYTLSDLKHKLEVRLGSYRYKMSWAGDQEFARLAIEHNELQAVLAIIDDMLLESEIEHEIKNM